MAGTWRWRTATKTAGASLRSLLRGTSWRGQRSFEGSISSSPVLVMSGQFHLAETVKLTWMASATVAELRVTLYSTPVDSGRETLPVVHQCFRFGGCLLLVRIRLDFVLQQLRPLVSSLSLQGLSTWLSCSGWCRRYGRCSQHAFELAFLKKQLML